MVRTYVRKTERGVGSKYSEEDLEKAIEDVKNGNRTTRGAATFYNIPRSTLKHRILGTRGKGFTSRDGKGGGGVKSFLPAAEEEEIVNCIKVMDKNGFGLSRHEVLDLVQLYIRQNNIPCRFKEQRPGADWFISFRIRHGLSIKKAQSIEHVRCDQVNPWVVYNFFGVLEKTLKELNLGGKPERIFNCDETSFCHDPSKTRVVGAIGAKSKRKTCTTGRENTSVLLCCSAGGQMLPLLCVFKGKYVMENWIDQDVASQTAVSASSRGWMETTLFFNWFRDVFLRNIGEDRPVLLIYDGHTTHISTQLIRLAQENQVTIMKLPPHTTHLLQPLDVAVFKSLKTKWDSELCKWQRSNPRKKIPKQEFVSLLSRLVADVPRTNIINGFKSTGIYDWEVQGCNKEAIPTSVFKRTDLEKYKKNYPRSTVASSKLVTVPQQTHTHSTNIVSSEIASSSSITQSHEEDAIPTATLPGETLSHLKEAVPLQVVDPPTAVTLQLEQSTTSTGVGRKSFEEVLLDLLKKEKKPETTDKKRKRLVTNCEIITSKEYLLMKENQDKEKQDKVNGRKLKYTAKEKKKGLEAQGTSKRTASNKTKRKKIINSDDETSEESDQLSLRDSDDDYDNLSHAEEIDEHDVNSIKTGEYCVVKIYRKSRKNFRLYIAKVTNQTNAGYDVVFFKRHSQTLKFMETEEESYVSKKDVIRKLSKPLKSSSARFRNMISFSDDLSDLSNIY